MSTQVQKHQLSIFDSRVFKGLRFLVGFPVIFVVVVAATAYFLLGQRGTESLVRQTHDRQLQLALNGTHTVTNFVKLVERSAVDSAKSISEGSITPQQALNTLADSWEDSPVVATIFVGPLGQLEAWAGGINIPEGETINLEDRDYYIWAKSAQMGESFVGEPIQSRLPLETNGFIVTISSPVYREGEFVGVVATGISLNAFAEKYLELLKFTESTRIYMVSADGTMLYSPYPQLQGINYIEYLDQNRFPGSNYIRNTLEQIAAGTRPGKLETILPHAQTRIPTRYIIAHAPVQFASNHWTISIASPVDEAISFAGITYINQLGVLVAAFLVILVFAIREAKNQAYKELMPPQQKDL